MVQAVREGWEAYLSDPAATNALMAKLNPTMDAQTFIESADAQKPLIAGDASNPAPLGSMTEARWQTLIQQLVELKVIDKPVPADQCFAEASNVK
jgi:NitT/TauT family transport system substrate-binding protein